MSRFTDIVALTQSAPSGSVIMFHACAHNPTGVDPTPEQWKEIATVVREKSHFSFFDMAYQGFASGDCVRDRQAVELFLGQGLPMALSQSYAKNMGMYGQRIGALSVVCDNANEAVRVKSQIQGISRAMYSNPPCHGAYLVSEILSDAALKEQWYALPWVYFDCMVAETPSLNSAYHHSHFQCLLYSKPFFDLVSIEDESSV